MAWRVLLTVLYAVLLGGLMALENFHPSMPGGLLLAAWLAAPVVGFLVGRWWVVFAVLGVVFGRAIGWDPADNDGNPAFWPPYVMTALAFVGIPLLLGAACSYVWRGRGQLLADDGG